MKGYLFVTGCGRSGTTLLNRLLGAHPRIVLGVERYMLLQLKNFDAFQPALFEKERFFTFRKEDSGQFRDGPSNCEYYDLQREKWEQALYRGDKITTLFSKFNEVSERLENVKFVHVTRSPVEVMLSWRARVEGGTLAPINDYIKCMETWNLANQSALEFKEKYPDKIILVDYKKILSDGYVDKLLDAIDCELGCPGELKEYVGKLVEESGQLKVTRKDRFSLKAKWRAFWDVRSLADFKQYKKLRKHML